MTPPINRTTTDAGVADRLFFAQVREDADIELAALANSLDGEIAVVSSGGCTALALLGAGAHQVHAVDLNITQNNLVELKATALACLPDEELLGFLGAKKMAVQRRLALFDQLLPHLSATAAAYWRSHAREIGDGVQHAGATEKFLAGLIKALRGAVVRKGTMEAFLTAPDLATQRRLYETGWNTRRWRAFLSTVCHRRVFDRVYAPEFFANTGRASFADHFGSVIKHVLTELPTRSNPYLHDLVAGEYADDLPAWLQPERRLVAGSNADQLHLWDAPMAEWLATRPDHSLSGVTLSNICEWLDAGDVERLFRELGRVVRPGGVVVLRNFVGWTDIPYSGDRFFEVQEGFEDLAAQDRSLMQYRVVVLRAREVPLPLDRIGVRELSAADSEALLRLARSNPINSSTSYVVDRSDFAPVVAAIPGAAILGGEDSRGLTATATLLPFSARLGQRELAICYLGGLVADPRRSGAGGLVARACIDRWADSGQDVLIWLTNNDNSRVHRTQDKVAPPDAAAIADVAYTEVMPLAIAKAPTGWQLRPVAPDDLASAIEFINAQLANRALHVPLTAESLVQLPGSSAADLLGLYDAAGQLRAAAQVRDPMAHARVIPIRFDAMSKMWERLVTTLRRVGVPLPEPPREGEPLRTLQLRRAAWTDVEAGRELLRQLGNLVLDRKVHSLSYVDDPRSPIPRAHKLVFTYPGQITASIRPGSDLTHDQLRSAPIFVDVSLT